MNAHGMCIIVGKLVMKWNLFERAFNAAFSAGGVVAGAGIVVAIGIGTLIYKRFIE
jgi:hypothetical protein